MKPNRRLKSKCQGIPFRMFTIMFAGFVTQLSVNGIMAPVPWGLLEYIDIQSEQTDWAHSVPAVIHWLWRHTLTIFSQQYTYWPLFQKQNKVNTAFTAAHNVSALLWKIGKQIWEIFLYIRVYHIMVLVYLKAIDTWAPEDEPWWTWRSCSLCHNCITVIGTISCMWSSHGVAWNKWYKKHWEDFALKMHFFPPLWN